LIVPAGHFRSQANILAATANGDCQVLLVDDHVHAVLVFIDDDRADFSRRQRANHELCRISRPENDVNSFTGQFIGHRRDSRSTHADAGTDRIDPLIIGLDGNLGAHAGVTGSSLDFQQAIIDFRDFQREELNDELRSGTRQDQLRTAGGSVDAQQICFDTITHAQVLARNHLIAWQHCFHLAGFDNRIAALHALDRPGYQMLLARQEFTQHLFALGVTNLLQNHLLGSLRTNATEVDGFERLLQIITDLNLGILLLGFRQRHLLFLVEKVFVGNDFPAPKSFEITGFAINRDAYIGVVVDALLGSRCQRQLQRAEDDVSGHVLFTCQNIYQQQDFAAHFFITS
jgi:hypothetical protein